MKEKIHNIRRLNKVRADRISKWRGIIEKDMLKKKLAKKSIRKPYTSALRTSRREGYFIRHKIWPLIQIIDELIPEIKQLITEKYNKTIQELRVERSMSMGDNTIKNIKLTS